MMEMVIITTVAVNVSVVLVEKILSSGQVLAQKNQDHQDHHLVS